MGRPPQADVPNGEPPRRRLGRRLTNALAGLLLVTYPLVVYFGLARFSTRTVALVLLVALAPLVVHRLRRLDGRALRSLAWAPVATIACLAAGALLGASGFVLLVPVGVNGVLLVTFATTLRSGSVPMIERFARLQEPELSEPKRRWCRGWTLVWVAFFAANGATALVLTLTASLAAWTTYNGLIAYLLIGVLVASEWIGRRIRFGRLTAPHDAGRP